MYYGGGAGDPIQGALSVLGKHSTAELCSQSRVSLLLSDYFYLSPCSQLGPLFLCSPGLF